MPSKSDESIKLKICNYCAYQERSTQEVITKMEKLEVDPDQYQEVLQFLREENYLNDMRFASTYVSSKFRLKRWGKYKIKVGLRQKGVDEDAIERCLDAIDPEEYERMLKEILQKKDDTLVEDDTFKRRYKLTNHALAKGFEPGLIQNIIEDMNL